MHRSGFIVALLLAACSDPLKRVELVEDTRILGARVEVEGDPSRAAPAAGETATVRFLVATPELEPRFGYALSICPEGDGRGDAACQGDVFGEASEREPRAGAPELQFTVPEDADVSGRLLVRGAICNGAAATDDADGCRDGAEGGPVTLEFDADPGDGEDVNHNPEFAPEGIELDGEPWSEATATDQDCSGLGYAEVEAGSEHVVTLELDSDAREPLHPESSLDPDRETLQVSHFSTAGELDRAFSTLPFDSESLRVEVSWKAPKRLETAELARFWFVVRDLRGGSAFTERALCVVP